MHVDGTAKPCCYALFSLGNVSEGADIETLWNGAKMTRLREDIRSNRINALCIGAGCPFIRSQLPDDVVDANRRYRTRVDPDVSDPLIWKLALLGHRASVFSIGIAYRERGDVRRAFLWLERAARENYEPAQYILGYDYRFGTGWWSRFTAARGVKFLTAAVDAKYPAAFAALGLHYHLRQDYSRALTLFQEGGTLGDETCYFWLSEYHHYGIIVPQSATEAERWLRLAASRGLAIAKEKMAERGIAEKTGARSRKAL